MTQLYFCENTVEDFITAGIPDVYKTECLPELMTLYYNTRARILAVNHKVLSPYRSGFYALVIIQEGYISTNDTNVDLSLEAIHYQLCQSMEEDIELDFDLIESVKPAL